MGNLTFGKIAFLMGIIIAIVSAFIIVPHAALALLILGLVVGLLNVTASESTNFLVAGIGLLLSVTVAAGLPEIGDKVTQVLSHITAFMSPAILVVALKSLLTAAVD